MMTMMGMDACNEHENKRPFPSGLEEDPRLQMNGWKGMHGVRVHILSGGGEQRE
jgi:hypothetical protein